MGTLKKAHPKKGRKDQLPILDPMLTIIRRSSGPHVMKTTAQVTGSYMKQLVKISWPCAWWDGDV